jgi:hypothetical protein
MTTPIKVAVQNHYEFVTRDGYLFNNAQSDIGHNLLKGWNDLAQEGAKQGIVFNTLDQVSPESIDVVIYMDRPQQEPNVPAHVKKILMIYEPDMLIPGNWDKEYHWRFDRVLTWNDELLDNVKYFKNNFTTDFDLDNLNVTEEEFNSRKMMFIMNTVKNNPHPDCLYGHRVFASQFFTREALFDFDIYGRGWDIRMFPNYRGHVQNKMETMRKYKFCLAYENCRHSVGYVTEKMLDCIAAGVVPVYYGAPNVKEHIPSECFIDVTMTDDYVRILNIMKEMTYERYTRYLDAMKEFVQSSKSEQFKNEFFVNNMINHIREIHNAV